MIRSGRPDGTARLTGRSSAALRLRGTSAGSGGGGAADPSASAAATFAQNRDGSRSPSSTVSQATLDDRAADWAQIAQARVFPAPACAVITVTGRAAAARSAR